MNPDTVYWLSFSAITCVFLSVICCCGYSCVKEMKEKKLQIETIVCEV